MGKIRQADFGRSGVRRVSAGAFLLATFILLGCDQSDQDKSGATGPVRDGWQTAIHSDIEKDGPEAAEGYRIVRVSISRQNQMLRRDFEVDMSKSGRFYLKAWAESPKAVDWTVHVDGRKAEDLVLRVEPGTWGYAELRRRNGQPSPVELSEGLHTLSFEGAGPAVPAIEGIWMS